MSLSPTVAVQPPKLLDQVRNHLRLKHYSYSTEKSYIYWIRNFIIFHGKKHPKEMGAPEIEVYLTWLAKERKIASSTQNQALNALVFLYKQILKMEPGNFGGAMRARKSNYIPEIIPRETIFSIIEHSTGVYKLMVMILYGCGLRVNELLRLRVKDVDIYHRLVKIYMGKGDKSRTVMLPEAAVPLIEKHLQTIRFRYEEDRKEGYEGVEMPTALERKYPQAATSWGWFWFFPAPGLSLDPRGSIIRRHHLHSSSLQKHLMAISQKLRITVRVTPHSFRHCFATHLLEEGKDISTVQRLLGHSNVKTTMVYLHVLESMGRGVASPLDSMKFRSLNSVRQGSLYAENPVTFRINSTTPATGLIKRRSRIHVY